MKKWMVAAGIVGILALGGGMAATAATTQASDETINACVNRGGAVRIVSDLNQCKTKPAAQAETPLSWSSGGGITGYEVVETTHAYTADILQHFTMETAFCPAGKVPLGGGATVISDEDAAPGIGGAGLPLNGGEVRQSGPWTGENGELGWMALFDIDNTFLPRAFTSHTYVICAFASP